CHKSSVLKVSLAWHVTRHEEYKSFPGYRSCPKGQALRLDDSAAVSQEGASPPSPANVGSLGWVTIATIETPRMITLHTTIANSAMVFLLCGQGCRYQKPSRGT